MADKSFGVKELNLLNASGTPTVTSPNNLNLNANTVAISTSCTIGNNLTVTSTTNSANLNVTGIGTLTRGFATDLSVSGISTISQPADSNPMANWTITNNSSSAYRFTGPGQSGTEDNPNIYLVRGHRYIFKHNATSSHPIQIRFANGGSAYTDGVTYSDTGNNRTTDGNNLIFNVQHDAPAQLFYQCTSHGSMVGNIYIVGGPQVIAGVVTATDFKSPDGNTNGLYAGNSDDLHLFHNGADSYIENDTGNLTFTNKNTNNIIFKTTSSETDRLRINSEGNVSFQPSNLSSTGFSQYMDIHNGHIKKYMAVKNLDNGEGTKFTFTGTDRTSALITIKVSHSWTASNTANRHGSAIYAVRIFTANGGSAGWEGITLIQAYGYSTGNFILSNESGYGYSIKVNNPLSDDAITTSYDVEIMSASNTSKHTLSSVAIV